MIRVETELLVMRAGMLVLCTLDMASARWQKNLHEITHYLCVFDLIKFSITVQSIETVSTVS
jgi:hypothetical protein